jgi:hypothetical protein
MENKVIKSYKGFNKDMTCRDFQFEEGKEYEEKGNITACNRGFHACEYPLDCFGYYPPSESVYHEVEQSGDIDTDTDDTKVASSKIKIETVKIKTTAEYLIKLVITQSSYTSFKNSIKTRFEFNILIC